MAWKKGDLITASKLNSENKSVISHTMNVPLNTSGNREHVCYIHKPAISATVVAYSWFHSLDGWLGVGSDHYIKMWSCTASGSNISLLINEHWEGHHQTSFNITGDDIPSSGYYKFYIQQDNKVGGEQITMRIYGYPQSAVSGHQIVACGSNGNGIYNKELSADNLNGRYITTK